MTEHLFNNAFDFTNDKYKSFVRDRYISPFPYCSIFSIYHGRCETHGRFYREYHQVLPYVLCNADERVLITQIYVSLYDELFPEQLKSGLHGLYYFLYD